MLVVNAALGCWVSFEVGSSVEIFVGEHVGKIVGRRLGSTDDFVVDINVCSDVLITIGLIDGVNDGYEVFWILGWYVGRIDAWLVVVVVVVVVVVLITGITDWFKIVTTNDVNKTVPIVLIIIEDNVIINS